MQFRCMADIPVTFDHEGKTYAGHLSQVTGMGSTATFHLYVDKYYWGTLRYSDFEDSWIFNSNKQGMEKHADYFGWVVVGWYE
jgi:hypothetical protein